MAKKTLENVLKPAEKVKSLTGVLDDIKQAGGAVNREIQMKFYNIYGAVDHVDLTAVENLNDRQLHSTIMDKQAEETRNTYEAVKEVGYRTVLDNVPEEKALGIAMSMTRKDTGNKKYDEISGKIAKLAKLGAALGDGNIESYLALVKNEAVRAAIKKLASGGNREIVSSWIQKRYAIEADKVAKEFYTDDELDIEKVRGYILANERKYEDKDRVGLYTDTAIAAIPAKKK